MSCWLLETVAVASYGNSEHFPPSRPPKELGGMRASVVQEKSKHWCVRRAAVVEYAKKVMFGLRKAKQK